MLTNLLYNSYLRTDNVKQNFRYHNNGAKASFTTLIQELIMSTPFPVS